MFNVLIISDYHAIVIREGRELRIMDKTEIDIYGIINTLRTDRKSRVASNVICDI